MRILLAADNGPFRNVIARGLREASYAVDEARTQAQTLEHAGANAYDAIVLDLVPAPGESVQACRELRRHGVQAPIIVVVSVDAAGERIEALDAGADDSIAKPFDLKELNARLRALTRRRGPVSSSRIVVGDLVIDSAQFTVRRGTRTITLTGKEFAILEYFARNAGRLVTRAQLSDAVWGVGKEPRSNLIDVVVNRVRRKVDANESAPLFTTHRARGYMLAEPGER